MNDSAAAALLPALRHLLERGQYGLLEREARQGLTRFPGAGALRKFLALALEGQGRRELAAWQDAAAVLADDPEVLYHLAEAYRAAAMPQEAEHCFCRVLDLNPGVFGAYLSLGMIRGARGRFAEAEADYRRALELRPDLVEAIYNLALLMRQQGRYAEAHDYYTAAIRLRPAFVEAHNGLGMACAALQRPAEAEAAFLQALQMRPDAVSTLASLGAFYVEQGREADAERIFRRLLEVYLVAGDAQYAQGQLRAAEEAYRQALRIQPAAADAWCGLATVLLRQGRSGEAEAGYRRALEIRPFFPQLHYRKGELLQALGRSDEALPHLRIALQAQGHWHDRVRRLSDPWVNLAGLQRGNPPPPAKGNGAPGAAVAGLFPLMPRTTLHEPVTGASEPEAFPARRLHIVLIYPPPWKIPAPGEVFDALPFGPSTVIEDHDPDGDFLTIPYGVLTLAAEARRAGHQVEVFNLANALWRDVDALVAAVDADVFGISAFTSNRRGMGAVAELIRARHPAAHITCGGPFVTALPAETLRHYRSIDTAVIGEGELTFIELLATLAAGRSPVGIAGMAWRRGDELVIGAPRGRIRDLDTLASPFEHFAGNVVMTSRGCPSKCSFCGSYTTWGRKLRFNSVAVCIDHFTKALAKQPVPFLAVKDDTFTAHRRRAMAICDAIIERGLNFLWSCDTRVDCLDEALLHKMRLAGCQRISLGVESGSQSILDTIRKDATPQAALEITQIARQYGIAVRFYMILGNRGETPQTVQESIDLIRAARPASYSFSCLGFSPGTEEWEILGHRYGLGPEVFFRNDFKELGVAYNRRNEWSCLIRQVQCEIGHTGFAFTVEELEAVVARMPSLPAAHTDLAGAYRAAGRLDDAWLALDRAEALGFPIPALIANQRACIALARGDAEAALAWLERALQALDHPLIRINRQNLLCWLQTPPAERGAPAVLRATVQGSDFVLPIRSDAFTVEALLDRVCQPG